MKILKRLSQLLIPVQVCILIVCIPFALVVVILLALLTVLDRVRGV